MLRAPWLLLACVVLACGSSDPVSPGDTGPTTITKSVGPDGDILVVQGATVTIPKGALTKQVEITISASEGAAPDGYVALSRVFKCEPSGTDFAQPVSMEMPFTDDGQPSSMFWSSGADPSFKDLGGTAADGTMSATVLHFSSGFVGRKK